MRNKIENKTENKTDKEISFYFENVDVDGFTVDTLIATEGTVGNSTVEAGKKSYFYLKFYAEEIVKCIDDLKEVSALVEIKEVASKSGDIVRYNLVDSIDVKIE